MTVSTTLNSLSTHGVLVISLDFELYWGMFDQVELTPEYQDVLIRTRDHVVPRLLELFDEYDVHVTWASVGLLFFKDKATLLRGLPTVETTYQDESLSATKHLLSIGKNEQADPFHYAPSLLKQIQSYSHQEIGSHSFSHYYCLEEGQTPVMFKSDAEAWNTIAEQYGIQANSICFARNQYAEPYLAICNQLGIKAYRGNENTWFYKPDSYQSENVFRKVFRWLDTYIPITRHQCISIEQVCQQTPLNIRSSRFLRTYNNKLRRFEPLKRQRIYKGMTQAAKQHQIYHLWWHPQDFGENVEKNFQTLEMILGHYRVLQDKYDMMSLNMSEIASTLIPAE